jgi:hypothetical protein
VHKSTVFLDHFACLITSEIEHRFMFIAQFLPMNFLFIAYVYFFKWAVYLPLSISKNFCVLYMEILYILKLSCPIHFMSMNDDYGYFII